MNEVHTAYQIFKKSSQNHLLLISHMKFLVQFLSFPFSSLPLSLSPFLPPSFPFFPSFYLPFSICMLYVSLTSVHMCLLVHEPVYLHVEVRGR